MKKWSLTGALLLATTPALLWSWGANAATAQDWRSRSIYQVITDRFARADGSTTAACNTPDRVYCGGSYRGIVDRLDYIQGMGFTAIWISPITYNFLNNTGDGTSYHGYWQQNLYELNPNFGPAEDLRALSDELHRRSMYLMVDVVVNHNGWDGGPSSVDYSQFYPFNSSSYFHPYCPVDYNDQGSIEDCWLGDSTVTLPDLKTEDPTVAGMYNTWIGQLVANYSIDGLRIDTVKHVDPAFWPGFNAASAVFSTGEVFDGDPSHTCSYQQYLDSLLNYPIYYPLLNGFKSTSGSTLDLVNMINSVKASCKDSTLLGSFSENHDNPRFASYTSDLSLARNVIAYTILADGVPIIYQGQEQHYGGGADPENREAVWLSGYDTTAPLYTLVAQLNQIRNRALRQDPAYLTYQNWAIYSDPTTIAMRKGFDGGQIVAVLSNKGADGAGYTLSLGGDHGWGAGTAVMEVLGCNGAMVDGSARLAVPMESGLPRVYYPVAQLTGSGICGL